MQVGTEILLARMKEYPEEFFTGGYESRWTAIIDDARKYLPKEDVEALDAGYSQMQVDRFNERVLARLAGEDKQVEETMTIKASGRYANSVTDARALYNGTTQQTYEQAYEQVAKRAQYDADQRRAMQAQNSMMGVYNGANGSSIGDFLTGGHK